MTNTTDTSSAGSSSAGPVGATGHGTSSAGPVGATDHDTSSADTSSAGRDGATGHGTSSAGSSSAGPVGATGHGTSSAGPVGATGHVSSSVPTGQTPIVAAPVRTLGIVALALGAASVLFGFTFLVPIAAIVVGIMALQREPDSRAFSLWGIVLGAVMSIGWLFVGIAGLAVALPFHFLSGL